MLRSTAWRLMNPKLPSHLFQPRLPPIGTMLSSSTMSWPMSARNRLPLRGSQPNRCGIAHAVGVDFAERTRRARRRDCRRECRTCRCGCSSQRIDPQDLAEDRPEVLRQVERIAAAAAVGNADVEQAEIRSAGPRERVEGDVAGVVIGKRLLEPHHLTRRSAVVGRRRRVLRRPFEQHRVVGIRSRRPARSRASAWCSSCRSTCRTCRSRGCRPARTAGGR